MQHGLPKLVLCDHDVALVKRTTNGNCKFTAAFYWLCQSLGVKIRACRPYRPQTKGRIERAGRYIKENALAEFNWLGVEDPEDLQNRLDRWIIEVADRRKIPALHGISVADAFKKKNGAHGNIVIVLPDRGDRYFSKHIFDEVSVSTRQE